MTLPGDVDPDSLSRLPLVEREAMDEQGQKFYDAVTGPHSRTLVGLQGPSGIWLHSPELGERVRAVNQYLRYETALERRLTERAILVTARELDHQFEWTAHEPAALKAIVMREFGPPEVMRLEEMNTPVPGPGEVLIRVHAVSVNRTLDLAVRAGTYPARVTLPHVLGVDPSGVVAEVGQGVTTRKVGDRVTTGRLLRPPTATA